MRTACRATLAMALSLLASSVGAIPAARPALTGVPGAPSWAGAGPTEPFGFSSPTVTQSGVTYAPNERGEPPPEPLAPLADLPAWQAEAPGVKPATDGVMATLGLRRFGNLPESAGWALVIAGFMIIGGALRGLIVVNRRLNRLRSGDESDSD